MIYISTGLFENKASQTAKKFIKKKIYNIELSAGMYDKNYINSLKLLNKDKKISLAVHNYFPTPKKAFVFNLASLDDKIFKLSFKHAKKAIKLAKTLGGKYYSFHAGFLIDPKMSKLLNGKETQNYIKILSSKKGAKILDFGCGSGWLSLELARNGCHV